MTVVKEAGTLRLRYHVGTRIVTVGLIAARPCQCRRGQIRAGLQILQRHFDGLLQRCALRQCYFLGAHGLAGAHGASAAFFFFFLAGPQGLAGAQGLLCLPLASSLAAGLLAALCASSAGAALASAAATISWDNFCANCVDIVCLS